MKSLERSFADAGLNDVKARAREDKIRRRHGRKLFDNRGQRIGLAVAVTLIFQVDDPSMSALLLSERPFSFLRIIDLPQIVALDNAGETLRFCSNRSFRPLPRAQSGSAGAVPGLL